MDPYAPRLAVKKKWEIPFSLLVSNVLSINVWLPVCWNIGVCLCFVNKYDSPIVFQVVFHLFDLPHYGVAV